MIVKEEGGEETHEIIMRRSRRALMTQFFHIKRRRGRAEVWWLLRRESVAITHLNTSSSLYSPVEYSSKTQEESIREIEREKGESSHN